MLIISITSARRKTVKTSISSCVGGGDEFQVACLNFQDARDLIRQARVARGFHPAVILASTADVAMKKRSEPGKKGSTKGLGKRGAGSHGKGKGQVTRNRPMLRP